MEEEDQKLAQIQLKQQQQQDAIRQHQEAKASQIQLEQEHQEAIRQRQEATQMLQRKLQI
jgi:hypothetical protein